MAQGLESLRTFVPCALETCWLEHSFSPSTMELHYFVPLAMHCPSTDFQVPRRIPLGWLIITLRWSVNLNYKGSKSCEVRAPADAQMWCYTQVMYALAALDVPEALSSGPQTAAELAPLVGMCIASNFVPRVTEGGP